jgi:hypothetical protein
MPSLAAASGLLSKCINLDQASPLLAHLGFPSTPVPLTSAAESALALEDVARDVRICAGNGPLRAVVFRSEDSELKKKVLRVASILSVRAPQLLFLIVGIDTAHRQLALGVFDNARSRTRVSALVVDTDRVVDSDAETICGLAAARTESSAFTYARWLEILGRESINRRFFRELERIVTQLGASVTPRLHSSTAGEIALLCVSRLLFLSFLETKGWLNGDHAFLSNTFADCMASGGDFHRRVLNPLFFGTLNTSPPHRARRAREFGRIPFLNGGLFARSPLECRHSAAFFSDESLGDVFGDVLSRYRFTAREDGTSWTEAAVDPEMLGKAFESLMSSAERKKSGAFYTPHSMVREVCHSAMRYGLASARVGPDDVTATLDGRIPGHAEREALLESTASVRVLDPACGSGAFLVYALEELASLRVRLGDLRAPHAIRREILTRSVFGVDLNPIAAWLCELRLWLAMAIEDSESDPLKVAPLPNLDRNIRIGDSLSGEAFRERFHPRDGNRIAMMRGRYARATGPRKKTLGRVLDSMERTCAIAAQQSRVSRLTHDRRELLTMLRTRDLFGSRLPPARELSDSLRQLRSETIDARAKLKKLRSGSPTPFSFSSGFADAAANGGFRIIVGNPPWIRTGNLDSHERGVMRERFVVYRNSAWAAGARLASAAAGFASQVDAAALFVERCVDLLEPGGSMSLILPAKLWRSLAGGGVRTFLRERTELREIQDLSSASQVFDAAVYPSVITATRSKARDVVPSTVTAAVQRGDDVLRWRVPSDRLPFDRSPGSPWLIAPKEVRAAFDAVRDSGIMMADSPIGRPLLGVKTGCNDAFIVSADTRVESSLLSPVIRGEQVRQWALPRIEEQIIWTHDELGPLKLLPPKAAQWLSQWRRDLERRADSRGRQRWWMLFRTDAAASSHARVVWSDIGKTPKAVVIPEEDKSVPLNTCYVARCRDRTDAHLLTAILNSRLAASWLALLAEPARGGYLRFMGWTMSLLPLPRDWSKARRILAPVSIEATAGNIPTEDALLEVVLAAYGLSNDDVAPLIEWSQ